MIVGTKSRAAASPVYMTVRALPVDSWPKTRMASTFSSERVTETVTGPGIGGTSTRVPSGKLMEPVVSAGTVSVFVSVSGEGGTTGCGAKAGSRGDVDTITVAWAVFVASAWLVARTW